MPSPDAARLKNIGPKSAAWLAEIGVRTRADLEALGPVMAYKILKHRRPDVNLLLLYALDGALRDEHWNALSPGRKADLQAEASAPLDAAPR